MGKTMIQKLFQSAIYNQQYEIPTLCVLCDLCGFMGNMRSLATTKLNRQPEELEFLLGRPLAEIVRSYGLRVEKDQEGVYHLLQDR